MEIALLSGSNSRRSGGLYNSVRKLAIELNKRDSLNISIFAHDDEFSVNDIEAYSPVELISYKILGPSNFGFSPNLYSLIKKYSPDIIHVQCIWMYLSKVSLDYYKFFKKPYLISPRGMLDAWALSNSSLKKKIIGNIFEYYHLRNASCIHALCQSEAESIRKFGLKNPISIIPNGVDIPKFTTVKLKAKDEKRDLLFLSRLHPKKGIENLLKAWQLNSKIGKFWNLVIAGEAHIKSYEKNLHQLINSLGIQDSVKLIGPRYHEQKDICYKNADAFILPSYSEGLPMAVLEAWSYKLPVIITPECNLPEGYINEAAIRIDTSPDSISQGLSILIDKTDLELEEMGLKGYNLVLERFTWDNVANEMYKVYEWVLGESAKPSSIIE